MTYGIPAQFLLMNEAGDVLLERHLEWVERRYAQESSRLQVTTAMIPRRFDVLMGRGGDLSEHTGNLRAFHTVELHREKYEKTGKFEKDTNCRTYRSFNSSVLWSIPSKRQGGMDRNCRRHGARKD
jgi:hypothetical protein